MSIGFFDKAYTKALGLTNAVACPACGEKTSLSLFESIDCSPLTLILGKPAEENFAICPKCAAVLKVNPNYMRMRKDGTVCYLADSDVEKNE